MCAGEGQKRLGDFEIIREIGRGGMGIVHEARQVSLSREVALKVISGTLGLSSKAIVRFRREAEAAGKLHHTNIVPIYATGEDQGTYFYAMELIDGPSLQGVIEGMREGESERPRVSDAAAATVPVEKCAAPSSRGSSVSSRSSGDGLPEWVWEIIGSRPLPGVFTSSHTGAISASSTRLRPTAHFFDTVAELIAGVADGLDHAHDHRVVHRDIKPGNLLLSPDGRLSISDFGLARMLEQPGMTVSGEFVGSPLYMSPEQITAGRAPLDHRTDIYSLGATLYELLTLEPPFPGEGRDEVISKIIHKEPRPPRRLNKNVPIDLETICLKALEKDPDRRYQTAGQMAEDLRRHVKRFAISARRAGPLRRCAKFTQRHKLPVALAAGILLVSLAGGLTIWNLVMERRARAQIPEITRLAEEEEYYAAYGLAQKVRNYIPDDAKLVDLWNRVTRSFSITTTPPGARISFKEYAAVDSDWIPLLGLSPLENIPFPRGHYRWKVEKQGFEVAVIAAGHGSGELSVELRERGSVPVGMVAIRTGKCTLRFSSLPDVSVQAPEFWMDAYEVTNSQFKEFVDRGGYQKRDYWEHEFNKDGNVLPWEQAMAEFRDDETERPGPSTWMGGIYPEGQEEYPVSGVSWYEASAYARFREKSLPTLYHWSKAACIYDAAIMVPHSNLGGKGPARVGSHAGMSHRGLHDMPGNVREWCWNFADDSGDHRHRFLVGGSWSDPTYMFNQPEAQSPWNRKAGNGFRCVWYPGGRESVPTALFDPIGGVPFVDYTNLTKCSDEDFQHYKKELYAYDPADPQGRVENTKDFEHWQRQEVTYDLAYGNQRMSAFLYLPKGVEPPYKTLVYFPGSGAFGESQPLEDSRAHDLPGFVIKSGRALLYPIYEGTYDRKSWGKPGPGESLSFRDHIIRVAKDFRRSIDYLQTRGDIDHERLGYCGMSRGAWLGPILMALEDHRIKAGVFMVGGFGDSRPHPAADPFNFAPRVKRPVLMVNAENDCVFPVVASQEPLYRFLGTRKEDKEHRLYPGRHGEFASLRGQHLREPRMYICAWLDRYLGDDDLPGS